MGAFPTGSPKDLVKSIADGFTSFTAVSLKKFQPPHLRLLLQNLDIVEREIRREQVDDNDFEGVRKKNFRLGNLKRARLVVHGFIKHRRIQL
ncbi:MAG: hypothetical protein M5R36_25345 [Deltaproteobacteria bacterium]|nr:hypothetical protein [Deltaproteobacteria bacterium]